MKQVNVRISENLLKSIKMDALENDVTIQKLINDLLILGLAYRAGFEQGNDYFNIELERFNNYVFGAIGALSELSGMEVEILDK